jgi:uncharacterized protein YuzE
MIPRPTPFTSILADQAVARTRTVRKNRSNAAVDYPADGSVVGIELLGARQGVDVTGVSQPEEVAAPLRAHGSTVGRRAS